MPLGAPDELVTRAKRLKRPLLIASNQVEKQEVLDITALKPHFDRQNKPFVLSRGYRPYLTKSQKCPIP
jgi:hypothetical protein